MAEYVVVKTYSFDSETEAAKFDNYREATAYLQWIWEDCYNDEIAAESDYDEEECYHESTYAKIQWEDGDRMEFHLIKINPKREEFPEHWENYVCE